MAGDLFWEIATPRWIGARNDNTECVEFVEFVEFVGVTEIDGDSLRQMETG